MRLLITAAEIFLAAMAAYGIYCAAFLFFCDRRAGFCISFRIEKASDTEWLKRLISIRRTAPISLFGEMNVLLANEELLSDVREFLSETDPEGIRIYIKNK